MIPTTASTIQAGTLPPHHAVNNSPLPFKSTGIVQAVRDFMNLGINSLPLPYSKKAPNLKDWPNFRPDPASLDKQFLEPCNLGVLLGKASNHLVDVDCDWTEAGQLASHLLPSSWTFGRITEVSQEMECRHVLYRCEGIRTCHFDAPKSAAAAAVSLRIIEILAEGAQVVVPPSVHTTGQPITWIHSPKDCPLIEVSAQDLHQLVAIIAGAALLARLWPTLRGNRHSVAVALAGACFHARWPREKSNRILEALLTVAADEEPKDRLRAVRDTYDRAEAGAEVTGLPTLKKIIGSDVVECLAEWWGIGTNTAKVRLATYDLLQEQQNLRGGDIRFTARETGGMPPATSLSESWPELIPFGTDTTLSPNKSAVYPIDALGPILGPAVKALEARQQVPTALAAQSCLAAAVCVAQQLFDVQGAMLESGVLVGADGTWKAAHRC